MAAKEAAPGLASGTSRNLETTLQMPGSVPALPSPFTRGSARQLRISRNARQPHGQPVLIREPRGPEAARLPPCTWPQPREGGPVSTKAEVEGWDRPKGTQWVLGRRAVRVLAGGGSPEDPHIHHRSRPSRCPRLWKLAGAIALRSLNRGQH